MKAFLMHSESDFDLAAPQPALPETLTQDLELDTMLSAMAAGDELIFDVTKRALLLSLQERDAIGYRQQVLGDCLDHADVVRELYTLAGDALKAEKSVWASLLRDSPRSCSEPPCRRWTCSSASSGGCGRCPRSTPTSSTLRGSARFFAMLRDELDEAYFELIARQLKALSFNRGMLMSARLTTGNKGTGYTLRQPREQSLLGRVFDRSGYSFTVPERDVNGWQGAERARGAGGELGRGRAGPGRRSRPQLLRDAAGRGRVLRRVPEPGRATGRAR